MTIKRLQASITQFSSESAGSTNTIFLQLSFMMLMEFVVFGSWFATLGLVLQTSGLASLIGPTYLLCAIAAMVSPLFLGALSDRFIESQKVLSLAHILGGLVLLMLPSKVGADHVPAFLLLVFVYTIFFMPTLGLVNSISLRHLGEAKQRFAYIRIFAPLGWVIAGFGIGLAGLSASASIFTIAAVGSFVLGIYSLTLPSTPPPEQKSRFSLGDLIGAKAFVLFKNRNFTVLILCSLLTSISLGVYNSFAASYLSVLGISNVAGALALGQLSEIVFIATIPFVLSKIGMKKTLLVGIAMWGVRFLLFSLSPYHDSSLAILGVALHGICNDFCIVIAAMYIDRLAPKHLAAQAQSWVILVFSGVGAAIGSLLSGSLYGLFVAPNLALGGQAWTVLWAVPIGIAVVNMFLWMFLFKDKAVSES